MRLAARVPRTLTKLVGLIGVNSSVFVRWPSFIFVAVLNLSNGGTWGLVVGLIVSIVFMIPLYISLAENIRKYPTAGDSQRSLLDHHFDKHMNIPETLIIVIHVVAHLLIISTLAVGVGSGTVTLNFEFFTQTRWSASFGSVIGISYVVGVFSGFDSVSNLGKLIIS
ncbi:uncharacterized protein LTR77_009999 [Saxophila tyrrhenica]|uniref:Uncharacterized protein n=1 Tax=Saxophila tyrrhenica TaxID=1690608 RepID=A0AAV9NWP1_9PEZI|nr:hypothetical protein LTR77_009999 [Saxophila tyrrhenica]